MTRVHVLRLRVLGGALALVGLFISLGFPASVLFATRGLIADIDRTPGLEVVDQDLRTLSLFSGSDADPSTVVVRVNGSSPAEAVHEVLQSRGFDPRPSPAPHHDADGYFQRSRSDSYDYDLYRILDTDPDTGLVTVGLSFWDTDSMLFAPFTLAIGLGFLFAAARVFALSLEPMVGSDDEDDAELELSI